MFFVSKKFFVSQKPYDELQERFVAEQNENATLQEQLKKEKLRNSELESQVDAEPVRHGYWIEHTLLREMGAINGVKCSICGHEKAGRYLYNYCPNCGSKMDEAIE